MAQVRNNIVANLVSSGWQSGVQLLVVPVYIYLLGVEGWGLLSAVLVFNGALKILDLGMSQALPKFIAKAYAAGDNRKTSIVLNAFELLYWSVGAVGALCIFFSAGLIATDWLNVESPAQQQIAELSIRLISVQFFFQWPLVCYQSGLIGIEEQVELAKLQVLFSTLKYVGAALVLWAVGGGVIGFQIWLAVMTSLELWSTRNKLAKYFRQVERNIHDAIEELKAIKRYLGAVSLVVLAGAMLTQLDKLILSGIVDTKSLGFYMVASTAAMAILQLVYPISRAFFPRLAALGGGGVKNRELNTLHLKAVTLLIVPVTVVVIVFSKSILLVWTQNAETAENSAMVLSVLSAGTMLNALYNVSYSNWLAKGQTRYALWVNLTSLIVVSLMLPVLVKYAGIVGASFSWAFVNTLGLLFGFGLMVKNHEISRTGIALVIVVAFAVGIESYLIKNMLPGGAWFILAGVMSFVTAAIIIYPEKMLKMEGEN